MWLLFVTGATQELFSTYITSKKAGSRASERDISIKSFRWLKVNYKSDKSERQQQHAIYVEVKSSW